MGNQRDPARPKNEAGGPLVIGFLVLGGCLVAGPARAEVPPAAPVPVAAAAESDEPVFTVLPVPLPLVAVFGSIGYENFKIGPTRHDVSVIAGYYWSRNYYYDPASPAPRPPAGFTADQVVANNWRGRANWTWRLTPSFSVALDGVALAGGPVSTGAYDPGLTEGASVSGGPLLTWSTLDEKAFPTEGWLAKGAIGQGQHFGGAVGKEDFSFQQASLDVSRYFRVGPDRTLAIRATAMGGWPKLAWIDKFSAGGGSFNRGYQWNRFTGDRLVSSSLEYRHMLWPDLLALGGKSFVGVTLGLASETYIDLGRAWEGRPGFGVPVLNDLRLGGGTGFLLTLNRSPLGRLELGVGPEGLFPVVTTGTAF